MAKLNNGFLRFKHVCLLVGVVLLILAMTVFAHACSPGQSICPIILPTYPDIPSPWSIVTIDDLPVIMVPVNNLPVNIVPVNYPPYLNIPSRELDCSSDLNRVINLWDYSEDENVNKLVYSIVSQSRSSNVNCFIDSNHFISCSRPSCVQGTLSVIIKATDFNGLFARDSLNLNFKVNSPKWNDILSVCINESKTRLIDLKSYASDIVDGNNLTYFVQQRIYQTSTGASVSADGFNCFIESGRYISCNLYSNQQLSAELKITATNSLGRDANTTLSINSNCFDANGNVSDSLNLTANSSSGIILESNTKAICMEKCISFATPLTLKNTTNQKKCFDFDTRVSPNYLLSVSVMPSTVCVNPQESIQLILNSNSCAAEARPYFVRVFASDTNLGLDFDYSVGSCSSFDGFRINESDTSICKGGEEKIPVYVRNTSSSSKKITLGAENPMVLPFFEKNSVSLASGEERLVNLIINTRSLAVGSEYVTLFGNAGDYHIEKVMQVNVVDCTAFAQRSFRLSVPNTCFDVRKGQNFQSQFTISRLAQSGEDCLEEKKDFFITASGMPVELSYSKISLAALSGKTITYTVNVSSTASAGKHYLTISASDGSERNSFAESKIICLNVLGEQKNGLFVNSNSKDVVIGTTEVFEIEAVNSGDLNANYSVQFTAVPGGITANFSENAFVLLSGASKKIFVAITPGPSALVGDNQKIVIRLDGPVEANATIYFNVKANSFEQGIEILSASSKITMKGNSKAEYRLMVRNNLDVPIDGVAVSIENTPSDINFSQVFIGSLGAEKVVSVIGTISSGDTNGLFSPVFIVSGGDYFNQKSFTLEVLSNPKSNIVSGLFAGLFSLGGINFDSFNQSPFTIDSVFGALLSAILIIIFIAVVIMVIAVVARPAGQKKEVWVRE